MEFPNTILHLHKRHKVMRQVTYLPASHSAIQGPTFEKAVGWWQNAGLSPEENKPVVFKLRGPAGTFFFPQKRKCIKHSLHNSLGIC